MSDNDEYKYKGVKEALPRILINLSGKPAAELFRWGFGFFIVYFGGNHIVQVAKVLAGKITVADLSMIFQSADNCDCHTSTYWVIIGILTLLSISVIVYGKKMEGLHRGAIETYTGRIRSLEKMLDEGRTTSGLTTRGETNPKDK